MYRVCPLSMVDNRGARPPALETILFANAATESFASQQARADYRYLWLGRYIDHYPDEFFVVINEQNAVLGYLAGSLVSNRPPLPGPGYYAHFPPDLTVGYPAHIHVNIRKDVQGAGLGTHLVEGFAVHCRERGCSGFHAVTAHGASAAGFFRHCGLKELAEAEWNGRRLLMLGRKLV